MTTPKPTKPQATELASVTAAAAVAPDADANHGRGGMYTMVNGQRVLVERTQTDHEVSAAVSTQSATTVNPDTATE